MGPVLVVVVLSYRPGLGTIALAVLAGVLSNLVPNALDLVAPRSVRPQTFGVLMSAQPALAAVVGLVLLGQDLRLHEWAGIAIIAATNAVVVLGQDRPGQERPGQDAVSTSASVRAANDGQ